MRTTVTPEQVDAGVEKILTTMGGAAGWTVGPVEVTALLRLTVMSAKGMGIPLAQVLERVEEQWHELPDKAHIRQAMRSR